MNKKINKQNSLKLVIFILLVVILIFIALSYFGIIANRKEADVSNDTSVQFEEDYMNMKNDSIMYNENSTIKELKEEYKITGIDDLYEVTTEQDGRKTLNVKTSINYKVAFCGMIKKSKPDFKELDSIFENNNINNNGIWIDLQSRDKILNYLNNNENTKSKYETDNEGYLKIANNDISTDIDKKIQDIINGDKQYVISINSSCYMVDSVTGDIIENVYNDLEEYQTYEYFQDENKMIIFITENKNHKLTNNEIFYSLINLI